MGLAARLREFVNPQPVRSNGWEMVNFEGNSYPLWGLNQTQPGGKIEDIDVGYSSLVWRAYQQNAIVFACMRARLMLFTEARFQFQTLRGGRPGDYFGNETLRLLEAPWPGATTGDLLKYMIADADLAGNAFILRTGSTLTRLRPDWTQIIHGSADPEGSMWDPESEVIGYAYQPDGPSGRRPWRYFDAAQVAHFAPIPDPLTPVRGMSWLTPILREIMGDQAATEHKLRFFENGGTPNLVVTTGYTDVGKLNEFMLNFRQNFMGNRNAYKAFGLTLGVDAKVVGADLRQIDFKVTQGAGETRIAAAAGVPPAVVGISEGLQGSALNSGNFGMAMRNFADLTMRPLWRNAAGSLERIIPPPGGSRLWYDDRDVPALKDDIKDAAEVQALQAQAMRQLGDGGWEPDAIVDFITSGDPKRLLGKHTGLLPVQLQSPGESPPPEPAQLPAGRDLELLVASETRMYQAQLAFLSAMRELPAPHLTIEAGAFTTNVEPPAVSIAEGAVQIAPPPPAEVTVNVEAPPPAEVAVTVEAPPPAEVTVNVEAPTPMATVLDRDPETGDVIGEHQSRPMSDALYAALAQEEARKIAGPAAQERASEVAAQVAERTTTAQLPAKVAEYLRANPPRPGEPGLTWQGRWQASATYSPGDAVEIEGSSYVAVRTTHDERPPSSPSWELLARKGDPGPPGVAGMPGGGGPGVTPTLAEVLAQDPDAMPVPLDAANDVWLYVTDGPPLSASGVGSTYYYGGADIYLNTGTLDIPIWVAQTTTEVYASPEDPGLSSPGDWWIQTELEVPGGVVRTLYQDDGIGGWAPVTEQADFAAFTDPAFVPTAPGAATGAGVGGHGSRCIDRTTLGAEGWYTNVGTIDAPVWIPLFGSFEQAFGSGDYPVSPGALRLVNFLYPAGTRYDQLKNSLNSGTLGNISGLPVTEHVRIAALFAHVMPAAAMTAGVRLLWDEQNYLFHAAIPTADILTGVITYTELGDSDTILEGVVVQMLVQGWVL